MAEYYIPGAVPAFVQDGQPFCTAELQYPGNWLACAAAEQIAAIGATVKPIYDADTQVLERPDTGWLVRDKSAAELAAGLESTRGAALVDLDAQAEAARARYITYGSGQAITYIEKEREARDLVGGGGGPWPFLAAEALATKATVAALAADVVVKADNWRLIAADIEAIRRGAKVAIAAATTPAAIRTVLAEAVWPAP